MPETLSEAGLVPDKDVAIRGVGGVPEIMAALKAKAVQAGTLSPPSSFVAQKAGLKLSSTCRACAWTMFHRDSA